MFATWLINDGKMKIAFSLMTIVLPLSSDISIFSNVLLNELYSRAHGLNTSSDLLWWSKKIGWMQIMRRLLSE